MPISDPWKDPIEPGDAFAMRDGSVLQVRSVRGSPPDVDVWFVNDRYAQYGEDAVSTVLKPQSMDIRQFKSLVRNEEPGKR